MESQETKVPVKKPIYKEEMLNKIFVSVVQKVEDGAIELPKDYSIANALQTAWFIIKDITKYVDNANKSAVEICTSDSISNALFKMVQDGLNPSKRQCSFQIFTNKVTGYELLYQREYQGSIALAKRYSGVQSVTAGVIYEGQSIKMRVGEDGIKKIVPFETDILDGLDKEIKGAWCVVVDCDGIPHTEVMSMEMIQKSWDFPKKKTFKEYKEGTLNDTQKDFKDQMCMKTVIKRACKPFINSSDDSELKKHDEDETPRLQSPKSIRDILPEPKTLAIAPTDVKQIEAPVQQQSEEPVPDWGNVD